jgi:hypothetical protein
VEDGEAFSCAPGERDERRRGRGPPRRAVAEVAELFGGGRVFACELVEFPKSRTASDQLAEPRSLPARTTRVAALRVQRRRQPGEAERVTGRTGTEAGGRHAPHPASRPDNGTVEQTSNAAAGRGRITPYSAPAFALSGKPDEAIARPRTLLAHQRSRPAPLAAGMKAGCARQAGVTGSRPVPPIFMSRTAGETGPRHVRTAAG